MTAKIEPWMMEAGAQMMREFKPGTHYPEKYTEAFAAIIVEHAPRGTRHKS